MRNELIRNAKRNRTVQIMYLGKEGKVSKRTVSVIKINSSTFMAYCHVKKSTRTFKFDNLLAVFPAIRTVEFVG